MDERSFFVLGAWAPISSRLVGKDRNQHTQATAVSKGTKETLPQQIPGKSPAGNQYARAACMRGLGREGLPTDPEKGAIECPRSETKTSSSSDETNADVGSRSGLARTSSGRRGSTPQTPSQGSAASVELPTVAEVLRTAKMFLQPTHTIERQFYADCYRACQVMPSSRSVGDSPALPYLSAVPEVALRLSCLGHRVVVRRVTDSKQYWSKSMTNLFCYCVLPGTGIGYVLDPGFKEHFRAGRMSDRYRDIWECLPPLFVGPPAKLVQLVQLLSTELQASFESHGRQLPPWRTFSCTINRWMSPIFRDLPVPLRRAMAAQVAAPAAAAAAAAAATGDGGSSGGGSSGGGAGVSQSHAGMIPAAEAQAFLRACDELLAGTASAQPYSAHFAAAQGRATAAAAAAGGTAAAGTAIAGGSGGWAAGEATTRGCGAHPAGGAAGRPHEIAGGAAGGGVAMTGESAPYRHQQQQQQQHPHGEQQAGGGAGGGAAEGGWPQQYPPPPPHAGGPRRGGFVQLAGFEPRPPAPRAHVAAAAGVVGRAPPESQTGSSAATVAAVAGQAAVAGPAGPSGPGSEGLQPAGQGGGDGGGGRERGRVPPGAAATGEGEGAAASVGEAATGPGLQTVAAEAAPHGYSAVMDTQQTPHRSAPVPRPVESRPVELAALSKERSSVGVALRPGQPVGLLSRSLRSLGPVAHAAMPSAALQVSHGQQLQLQPRGHLAVPLAGQLRPQQPAGPGLGLEQQGHPRQQLQQQPSFPQQQQEQQLLTRAPQGQPQGTTWQQHQQQQQPPQTAVRRRSQ